EAHGRGRRGAFEAKILALAVGFAGAPPLDFANASFAELFAWSLAQPAADEGGPHTERSTGEVKAGSGHGERAVTHRRADRDR
ncbi:MAG: hypothetical protein JO320_07240, partial [Alphaproteobacteria bacterium]|nr:hypothetical protein [Alphaproteobacteria bacterium]